MGHLRAIALSAAFLGGVGAIVALVLKALG